MPTLEDLFFLKPGETWVAGTHPANPFLEEDGLLEAQILDIRHDGIRSVLGIILEMRVAEKIHATSTALIVASDVRAYSWKQTERHGNRTAWTIISSVPQRNEPEFTLELTTSPSAALAFTAQSASFYSLRIDELEDIPPPDYGDPDFAAIRSGIAGWESPAEVVAVAHS